MAIKHRITSLFPTPGTLFGVSDAAHNLGRKAKTLAHQPKDQRALDEYKKAVDLLRHMQDTLKKSKGI